MAGRIYFQRLYGVSDKKNAATLKVTAFFLTIINDYR